MDLTSPEVPTPHLELLSGSEAAQVENSPHLCHLNWLEVEKVERKQARHHTRDTKDTATHRCLANRLRLEARLS